MRRLEYFPGSDRWMGGQAPFTPKEPIRPTTPLAKGNRVKGAQVKGARARKAFGRKEVMGLHQSTGRQEILSGLRTLPGRSMGDKLPYRLAIVRESTSKGGGAKRGSMSRCQRSPRGVQCFSREPGYSSRPNLESSEHLVCRRHGRGTKMHRVAR